MNLSEKLVSACGKPIENCTNRELYEALLTMVQQEACARTAETGKKKVYYISAEFLIGKLLSNNLINLGWYDEIRVNIMNKLQRCACSSDPASLRKQRSAGCWSAGTWCGYP